MLDEVESVLDVLDDRYANKLLAYAIVEVLAVRVLPELGSRGVVGGGGLMEERLN